MPFIMPFTCTKCGTTFSRKAGLEYHEERCQVDGLASGATARVSAQSICEEAARLVGGDRQVAHGDKTINFQNTADFWTALLRAKARRDGAPGTPLTALDVANMLEAFKIARRYSGSHNPDDYIDGAGYAGCAGEIASHDPN